MHSCGITEELMNKIILVCSMNILSRPAFHFIFMSAL